MVSSNDARRLFLQAILSRRYMSTALVEALWKRSVEVVKAADETLQIRDTPWDELIVQINTSLNSLDLEFSRGHDEETGTEMWALVNRRDDDIAKVASDYTPQDIAYFKALVEDIITAPNNSFSVSSLAAMRDPPKPASMTKTYAEAVLTSFVARGWLLKSKKGRYSLSSRSLLELQQYLKSTYPDDILECTICLEIITKGTGCYTTNCKSWMHTHCFKKYTQRNSRCPACQEDWAKEANAARLVPVGEKAAKADDMRRTRRPSSVAPSEAEAQDSDASEGEAPKKTQGNGSKAAKRTSRRVSRSASAFSNADLDAEGSDEEVAPPRRVSKRRA